MQTNTQTVIELPDNEDTLFNRVRHIRDMESKHGSTSFNLVINGNWERVTINSNGAATQNILGGLEQQGIQVDLLKSLFNQGYTSTEIYRMDRDDINFIDASDLPDAKLEYFIGHLADSWAEYETYNFYLDTDFYNDMTDDYTFMVSENNKGYWVMGY